MADRMDNIAHTLLTVLSHQLHVLDKWMIEELVGKNGRNVTRRLLKAGLLRRYDLLVHPIPTMHVPLWTGDGTAQRPNYYQLSHRGRTRWTKPVKTKAVYAATGRATRLVGGSVFRVEPHKVAHDLLLSHFYLKQGEEVRIAWTGEAIYQEEQKGDKCPDAMLFKDGRPFHVVESAGMYSEKQIRAICEWAFDRNLSIDLI